MAMLYFKFRKPRGFHYQPRYWNPEQEAKQAREARIRRQLGIEDPANDANQRNIESTIKGAFRSKSTHVRHADEKKEQSTSHVLIISLVLLLIAAYFIFFR